MRKRQISVHTAAVITLERLCRDFALHGEYAQLCEKYRKKVLQDARDCKYQENERYFNEITAKLGDID